MNSTLKVSAVLAGVSVTSLALFFLLIPRKYPGVLREVSRTHPQGPDTTSPM
jgi:hypothetical protein